MQPHNSPQVWDGVWEDLGLMTNYQLVLAAEAQSLRWQKVKKILFAELGSLKGKRVLEIGSGVGTYAGLMAKEGARATLLDYSPKALEQAKTFFAANQLPVNLIQGDALHLPWTIINHHFDISVSVGLTEHFRGAQRLAINRVHLDVLRKGGIAVILTPNAYNPPYRIYKWLSELLGRWKFGEEYPYTRRELQDICRQLSAEEVALYGDDFYSSLRFVLPANFLRRFFRVGSARTTTEIITEKGTRFDDLLGYCFILVLKKTTE